MPCSDCFSRSLRQGYDLRKIFSSTSMRTYSDSPGAIYPALGRLERQGFIRGTIEAGAGLRRRQVFRRTLKGLAELKKWIVLPISRDVVVRGRLEIRLRFAFSEQAVGGEASLELLRSLEAALAPHLQALREEAKALKSVAPLSGRLAFEAGLRGTETLLQWSHFRHCNLRKKRLRRSVVKLSSVIVRAVAVFAAVSIAERVAGMLAGLVIPVKTPIGPNLTQHFLAWMFLTNAVTVAALTPLAVRSEWRRSKLGAMVAAIPVAIFLINGIEGAIFLKNSHNEWPRIFLTTIIAAALSVPVWMLLFGRRTDLAHEHFHPIASKSLGEFAWKFAVCDISYRASI